MTQAVKVNNSQDIIRLLQELSPDHKIRNPDSIVSTTIRSDNSDVAVMTETHSKSKREILLEGLNQVKQIMESDSLSASPTTINGMTVSIPKLSNLSYMKHPVDETIKSMLDADRDGMHIVWKLPSGVFKYDIYEHALTKVDNGKS
jgi:hypothetical protein